ncbi:MAG: hypothetical protein WC303_02835 [Candidatus Paceibacterota bacterium]|jgi:orotate phosphoribosyltransferase
MLQNHSKDRVSNKYEVRLRRRNAMWIHNGKKECPHAELTSGLCSNAYFNLSEVCSFPFENHWLASSLCANLRAHGLKTVDFVVGSAYAAITFSYEVANCLGSRHVFAEKGSDGEMLWNRFQLPKNATVLQIEELVTTFKTTEAVRRVIIEKNKHPVKFLPLIGTIVHRPQKLPIKYFFDNEPITIVPLIEKEVWAVPQEECPLCRLGSKRVKPKNNWADLIEC